MSDKKVSLSEVNQSIATPKNAGFFRTLLAFQGRECWLPLVIWIREIGLQVL